MANRPLTACGAYVYAGGFSVGVERAGFDVIAHLEGDNAYGVDCARLNWPNRRYYHGPANWPLDELRERRLDFVFSNPPCAIWSSMGVITTRGPNAWRTDARLEHWYDCFRVLEKARPRAWCLESVTNAYLRNGREVIDEMTKRALMMGYSVTHLLLDASWHGLPQSRKRFFIVVHGPAMLTGYQTNWAPPPTIGDVLAEVSEPGYHTPIASDRHLALIRETRPGEGATEAWNRFNPDPAAWVRNAHGKVSGRPSFQDQRLDLGTTMGAFIGDKFIHPVEDRLLGVQEAKAICGYPQDFKLAPPERGWASMLARAVMPPVGAWLARAIADTLNQGDAPWESRRVTLVDVRKPDIDPVDLTPDYLDASGRVRIRIKAAVSPSSVSGEPAKPVTTYYAPVAPARVLAGVEPRPAAAAPIMAPAANVDQFTPLTGEGSGRFIQRLWLTTQLSPEAILALVHENYPGRTTAVGDVRYNYYALIKARGETAVRPWPTTRTKKSMNAPRSDNDARQGAIETPAAIIMEGTTPEPSGPRFPQVAAVSSPTSLAARSTVVPERRGTIARALLYFSALAERANPAPISSARIAWFLEDEIKFDAVYHAKAYDPAVVPARIEELWVVNSSWMWMKDEWRRVSMRYFAVANRVIFVQNDYALYLNSYHLGAMREDANYVVLTTAPETSMWARHETRPVAVDWNVLTYLPRPETDRDRQPSAYYYGSFRTGRKLIFDRYLTNPPRSLVISATNGEDVRHFRETYPNLTDVRPRAADVYAELEGWAATLLLEDDKSQAMFVSPPNRFYEALSSRCPMIFDRGSIPMFARYGYDVEPFAVDGPAAIDALISDSGWLNSAAEDQLGWNRDYVGELRQRLAEITTEVPTGAHGRIGVPANLKRYRLTEDGGEY